MGDDAGVWFPTTDEVVAIHESIVAEYPGTDPGVRDRGAIEFALEYARGTIGPEPESIHDRAYHLLRLLTANHPFVDANKRTALDVVATFYFFNELEFDYDHEVRTILKAFASDAESVEKGDVVAYFRTNTSPVDLEGEVEQWRNDLVSLGADRLDELREEKEE